MRALHWLASNEKPGPLMAVMKCMKITTRIDPDDTRKLIAGAAAHAGRTGIPMYIAVTDGSGQLLAFDGQRQGDFKQARRSRPQVPRRRRTNPERQARPARRPAAATLPSAAGDVGR